MPLEERKDRWNAMMTVLRANSIHDWTAHFLQALGNDREGGEIDSPLTGGARLPAAAGLSQTLPLSASLGGIRGAHL
jgi:trehalose-6-phosphate synthase